MPGSYLKKTENESPLMKDLREAGSTGCDLSPGDPLARAAWEEIVRLNKEIEQLNKHSDSRYVRFRIHEADKYRDRYAHMALKCVSLKKKLDSASKVLKEISEGTHNSRIVYASENIKDLGSHILSGLKQGYLPKYKQAYIYRGAIVAVWKHMATTWLKNNEVEKIT